MKAAKEKEIQQLHSYGTFEELDVTKVNPDDLDKAIAATWVITEKGDPGKEYIKARLCCRGDKEQARRLLLRRRESAGGRGAIAKRHNTQTAGKGF